MIGGMLSRFQESAYVLMRIFFGLLFLQHGAQKVFGLLGGGKVELVSQMGVAGIIEFFGGLAIVLGLFTQLVALICAAEMVVAYFMAHAFQALWPIQNRGELALLYLFGFLFIMSKGPGCCSLDNLLSRSKSSP